MWFNSTPNHEGWYLCAWPMGKSYIYSVGKWNGKGWETSMTAEPHIWQEITSPKEQDKMLDELYQESKTRKS
jgi:inosine/xanthosine triphosphate pyrophosphatase family protein